MTDAKFKNGDLVQDTVTGYEGMIVCTCLWINGCYRYVVQAKGLQENGEPLKDVSVDEHQLVLMNKTANEGNHETGGPRPHVTRGQDRR